MKYYFHIEAEDARVNDEDGIVCDDALAALAHAQRVARMFATGAGDIWDWRTWTIEVAPAVGPSVRLGCGSLVASEPGDLAAAAAQASRPGLWRRWAEGRLAGTLVRRGARTGHWLGQTRPRQPAEGPLQAASPRSRPIGAKDV